MSVHMPRSDMLTVLKRLGLSSNLRLCLDAGHESSYPGSGQTWFDLSGTGENFNRGANSSSGADDPTFNGVAGRRSDAEYWSVDGGDVFTKASANTAWVQNLHKAGAKLTLATWVFVQHSADHKALMGTSASNTAAGFDWRFGNIASGGAGGMNFRVANGSGTPALAKISAGWAKIGAWNFLAISVDEAANTGAFFINGASEAITTAYGSPASGNAGSVLTIAARAGVDNLQSGNRIAQFMAWEGRALSSPELLAIFTATRSKFGV